MRMLEALQLPAVKPNQIDTRPPEICWVDPRQLSVDEAYQRALSDRSIRLISKIVANWNWCAFKLPVVVAIEGGHEVIDGQHTVIAAVTHGGIDTIPVQVIKAEGTERRASAFVRHNRDRIQVTATQLHSALVAAGDEAAVTLAQVCERAGVRVLRNPPPMARFKRGDTMAVTTINNVIGRRFAIGARKVLYICVAGGLAPISADAIRAVEALLYAPEYAGEIDAATIGAVLSANGSTLPDAAKRFANDHKVPIWRALATVIYQRSGAANAA